MLSWNWILDALALEIKRGAVDGGWARRAPGFGFAAALLVGLATSPTPAAASAWALKCDPNVAQCEMRTDIVMAGATKPVAQLALYETVDRQVVVEQRLPTGAHIPSGVVSTIDGSPPFRNELIFCDASWCVARVAADRSLIDQMRRGFVFATRIATPETLQPVTISFSLVGFTATLNTMVERSP